jgi:hypothetical protein
MSVVFQVQVGSDNIASRSYNGAGPCSRAEGKRLLEEIYTEACRERHLDGNLEFRDAIDSTKRAIDNAVGGADAGQNRAFYRKQFPTNKGCQAPLFVDTVSK